MNEAAQVGLVWAHYSSQVERTDVDPFEAPSWWRRLRQVRSNLKMSHHLRPISTSCCVRTVGRRGWLTDKFDTNLSLLHISVVISFPRLQKKRFPGEFFTKALAMERGLGHLQAGRCRLHQVRSLILRQWRTWRTGQVL